MKRLWRVYALRDPRDHAVRYIGVTSQHLATRLAGHCRGIDGSLEKRAWIAELAELGLVPEIVLLDAFYASSMAEAQIVERKWAYRYLIAGADLLNEVYIIGDREQFRAFLKKQEV